MGNKNPQLFIRKCILINGYTGASNTKVFIKRSTAQLPYDNSSYGSYLIGKILLEAGKMLWEAGEIFTEKGASPR